MLKYCLSFHNLASPMMITLNFALVRATFKILGFLDAQRMAPCSLLEQPRTIITSLVSSPWKVWIVPQ